MFSGLPESLSWGLTTAWKNISTLLRILSLPFIICLFSVALGILAGNYFPNNKAIALLAYLPGVFASGWVVASISIFATIKLRDTSEKDKKASGIAFPINYKVPDFIDAKAGVIYFALATLIVYGLAVFVLDIGLTESSQANNEMKSFQINPSISEASNEVINDTANMPAYQISIPAVLISLLILYNIKYMWLAVPLSIGFSLIESIKLYSGVNNSMSVLAIYITCMLLIIPLSMLFSYFGITILGGDIDADTELPFLNQLMIKGIAEGVQLMFFAIVTLCITHRTFYLYLQH